MSNLIASQNRWEKCLTHVREWRPLTVDDVSAAAAPIHGRLMVLRSTQRVAVLLLAIPAWTMARAVPRFIDMTPTGPDILLASFLVVLLLVPSWRRRVIETFRGAFRSNDTLMTQARLQAGPAPMSAYDIQAVTELTERSPELREVWRSWMVPDNCIAHRDAAALISAGEAWDDLQAARAADEEART